jgi:tetratricopeptide (TPR) repeat protein
VYSALGRWAEAGDEFELAATMGTIPPGAPLKALLAQLRRPDRDERKHLAVLQRLVKANPRDTLAWNRLGIWYFKRRQFDKAAKYFAEALKLDTEYVPALNNLAGVYYERGDFGRAVETCRRVLDINPRAVKAYVNMGRAYYLAGEKERAFNAWRAALRINPDDPEARACLSTLGGE